MDSIEKVFRILKTDLDIFPHVVRKESVDYGKRWNVEIYFSVLKRNMGEVIKVVRSDYTAQEIALKVQYYNILMKITNAY